MVKVSDESVMDQMKMRPARRLFSNELKAETEHTCKGGDHTISIGRA